jgi:hypothetical protein
LKTDECHIALDRYQGKRKDLLNARNKPGRIELKDFWETYKAWSWVEKPAQANRNVQPFPKIQEYLDSNHQIKYLDEIERRLLLTKNQISIYNREFKDE